MKASIVIRLLVGAFVVLLISSKVTEVYAQKRGSAEIVGYNEVLDFVFAELFVGRGGTGYAISIRYTPYRSSELQLTVMETSDGEISATLFTPEKRSVRDQFDDYVSKHPKAKFEQVIENIRVRKQKLALSRAEIRKLRHEILDVIARSIDNEREMSPRPGPAMIAFHEDGFELDYIGASSIKLSGGSPKDYPEPAFITWMKEKRPVFERMGTQGP